MNKFNGQGMTRRIIKNREMKFIERFCRANTFIVPRADVCYVKVSILNNESEIVVLKNGEEVSVVNDRGKDSLCLLGEKMFLVSNQDLE